MQNQSKYQHHKFLSLEDQGQSDKYKRITQAQFDLWIDNPVTKAYLKCLKWSGEQAAEIVGNGSIVDISNNDKSMNSIHSLLGQKIGLTTAGDPIEIFNTHQMLELPKEEEDDDTNN